MLLEAAQRFEAQDRREVADALLEMILVRFGDTAAATEVRQLLAQRPGGPGDRSGNVELQVWSTLYGLWLGVAVPMMAGADGAEPYGVGLLLGGPAGFLASRSYARSRTLSEGQARAITWGGTWGTWQGLGWANVLDIGKRTEQVCPAPDLPCFDEEVGDNTEEIIGTMVAGGLAGITAGAILSRRPITAGLATTVSFGSLWGTWFGFAASYLAGLEGDELLAGTLVGGNVGLVATALIGPDWALSRNRARLISIAGVAGGLGGAGIDLILQPDDDKVLVAIPLAGSLIGLAVGAATTQDYDRRTALAAHAGAERKPRPEAVASPGAMVRLDEGRWAVGAPLPIPSLVPDLRGSGGLRPAVAITLLDARF